MKYEITKPVTLGVDVGGTKTKTALVDSNGQILSTCRSSTCIGKDPDAVISDLVGCIEKCVNEAEQDVKALGIGVAAQVDTEGVVTSSQNLNWRNVSLKESIRKKLALPTVVVNDVRAAAWGEWLYGSGKGVDDLVVLFVGTGIGGGVVSGGKMLVGCSNSGGELGHITIVAGGHKCHCPNSGCLEAYAGGWAIAERAQHAVEAGSNSGQHLISIAGSLEGITAATVGQAFREGDELARMLVEETGRYLGAGVVSIVNAFNPCLLVLGGGVIEGLPELIGIVEKEIRHKALESSLQELNIVKAALGDDAGVVGAATLAQKEIGRTH